MWERGCVGSGCVDGWMCGRVDVGVDVWEGGCVRGWMCERVDV